MPMNRQVGEQNTVYPHTGVLIGNNKIRNLHKYNTDEP